MDDKKFNAILAKNEIAREIAKSIYLTNTEDINIRYIQSLLMDIENYIGTANQPTVGEIIANNTDTEKQFNI